MNINSSYVTPVSYKIADKNKNVSRSAFSKTVSASPQNKQYKDNLPSFGGLFTFKTKKTSEYKENMQASDFSKALSQGVKDKFGCDIPPENFENIMSPEAIAALLPNLKEENFISSAENQKTGVYFADLDYQSNFSSGKESVGKIMSDVAVFANKYYAETGKDFVFALTDRDCTDGLQYAVRIIGENPARFQHVKFVPGIKLSFAHEAPESKLKYENSDMLVYGVNPFSKNITDFLSSTIYRRKDMCMDFIRRVKNFYPEFSYDIKEFAEQNRLKYNRDYTVSNLYWRAREYAERKGGSDITGALPPERILLEADDILDNLEQLFAGSDYTGYSAVDSEVINEDEKVNKNIDKVFKHYATHYDEDKGKAVSSAENLYDDMIDMLEKEPQKPLLAFSAPYYFSHYFTEDKSKLTPETLKKTADFFKALQEKSKGMITAFESAAPMYDLDFILGRDTIDKFNNYMRENTDLYEVGGSFAKRNMP